MARLMPDRLPLRSILAGRGTTIAVGVAVLVGIPLAAGAGYVWLRDSSAFAVRDVQVRGADVALASQLRTATLDAVSGRSLLAVSSSALQRDLERLPQVEQAWVDRDFPSTLRIRVVEAHPIAVLRSGRYRSLVSPAGRVLRVLGANDGAGRLPLVWLGSRGAPAAGSYVRDADATVALAALRSLPPAFGARVLEAGRDPARGAFLRLGALRVYLGFPAALPEKLAVAKLLLAAYPTGQSRDALDYLDVSSLGHPVVHPRSGDPQTTAAAAALLQQLQQQQQQQQKGQGAASSGSTPAGGGQATSTASGSQTPSTTQPTATAQPTATTQSTTAPAATTRSTTSPTATTATTATTQAGGTSSVSVQGGFATTPVSTTVAPSSTSP